MAEIPLLDNFYICEFNFLIWFLEIYPFAYQRFETNVSNVTVRVYYTLLPFITGILLIPGIFLSREIQSSEIGFTTIGDKRESWRLEC